MLFVDVVSFCYQACSVKSVLNSLLNDKILDVTKVKAFIDNKNNVAQMMISIFYRVENIVGKGENAGYQHFLLFPQCFQKASLLGSLKMWELSGKELMQLQKVLTPVNLPVCAG